MPHFHSLCYSPKRVHPTYHAPSHPHSPLFIQLNFGDTRLVLRAADGPSRDAAMAAITSAGQREACVLASAAVARLLSSGAAGPSAGAADGGALPLATKTCCVCGSSALSAVGVSCSPRPGQAAGPHSHFLCGGGPESCLEGYIKAKVYKGVFVCQGGPRYEQYFVLKSDGGDAPVACPSVPCTRSSFPPHFNSTPPFNSVGARRRRWGRRHRMPRLFIGRAASAALSQRAFRPRLRRQGGCRHVQPLPGAPGARRGASRA